MDEMNVTPEQPKKKIKVWQIAIASVACLALLVCLSVVMWWSIAGINSFDEGMQAMGELFGFNENDIHFRNSYTKGDKAVMKNRDKIVASIGDEKLTSGQLQVYYWNSVFSYLNDYGYYAISQGLDISKPLDEQSCPEVEGYTWQKYFLEDALGDWQKYQAMALIAEGKKMELPEDLQKTLDNLRQSMSKTALDNGFSSLDAMVQNDFGPGCTFEDFEAYMQVYFAGYAYFNDVYSKIEVSSERLEQYFRDHEAELKKVGITKASGKYYAVRHILIEIEGGTEGEDGKVTYSEADWEACRDKAQKLLDEWLAGAHTEASFAELAKEHSADGGSSPDGGLYSRLDDKTNFVKPFKDWYLEKSRETGDYGLVKSDYGYHIMYFSGAEEKWETECRSALLSEESQKILEAIIDQYPMDVNYKNIVLGEVSF